MQEGTLHGLGIALATKLFFQDGLAAAAEAASHPRPADEDIRMQNAESCSQPIQPESS